MKHLLALSLLVACSSKLDAPASDNRAITYALAANHDAKCIDWGRHGGMADADTAWCDIGGGAMFWCVVSAIATPHCELSVDNRPKLPEPAKAKASDSAPPKPAEQPAPAPGAHP